MLFLTMRYRRSPRPEPGAHQTSQTCLQNPIETLYTMYLCRFEGKTPMSNNGQTVSAATAEQLGLILDSGSFVPYYEQIVDQVRSLIKANRLREGQTFCSEGDIARTLAISKMPVRQAFQKLRSEGLLVIARGKRPVIGSGRVPWNFQQLRGFSEEMKRRGLVPSARLLSIEIEEPELEVAQFLKLSPGERVYRARRLRFVNGEPVALVTSY